MTVKPPQSLQQCFVACSRRCPRPEPSPTRLVIPRPALPPPELQSRSASDGQNPALRGTFAVVPARGALEPEPSGMVTKLEQRLLACILSQAFIIEHPAGHS